MSEETVARRTALYDRHVSFGGKIVDFYGWSLPVQYKEGIIAEHLAVRNAAGLFDVSHMGEVIVEGKGSEEFLNMLLTNSLEKLYPGKVLYSPMCYKNGGTVDDLIVYMLGPERYFIVVNASNTQKDYEWMLENVKSFSEVKVTNVSDEYSQLAIQGPKAEEILRKLCAEDLSQIKFFHFKENVDFTGDIDFRENTDGTAVTAADGTVTSAGEAKITGAIVSRTGYTGEDGFEIYLKPSDAPALWDMLIKAGSSLGLSPAGLGARDTLRLEAGLPLYGHELSQDISPIEAGLGKFVSFKKPEFNGREALLEQHENGSGRKLTGFEMIDRGVPRAGYEIEFDGSLSGFVASGTYSPSLETNIGTAFVPEEQAEEGARFGVMVRGKALRAQAVKLPFNRKRYKNREDFK